MDISVAIVEDAPQFLSSFRQLLASTPDLKLIRNGGGLNQSFTVRKISYGEGVERVFPLFSPNLDSIKVIRKGKVRRAKLYYLRDRRGKSARIAERVEARPAKGAKAK